MRRARATSKAGSGITQGLLYIRVSSDDQEREGYSLPAQLADCRRYAAQQGWVIAQEYVDVLKGTRDDRPEYQAMLTEARRLSAAGQEAAIVCKWLHRLGRKVLESVRCREEFKKLGVPIHSIMEGGEVDDLRANIMASVAEYEVQQLGERVSEVREHVRRNGWKAPGRTPWGYLWRESTPGELAEGAPKKVLDLDASRAPTVVEAFRRVAEGESIQGLCRWVARLTEEVRGGRNMGFTSVRVMLSAPVYLGQYEGADGELHRGRWPALIDPGVWAKVQAQIASHRNLHRQASGRYLLTGVLYCPNDACGARMAGKTRASENRGEQYGCLSWSKGAAGATGCHSIALAAPVEQAVVSEMTATIAAVTSSNPRVQAAIRRAWNALRVPAYKVDALAAVRRHEGERGRARKRLADAAIKLVDGTLDKAGYDLLRQRVESDLAAAESELVRLRAEAGRAQPDLPEFEQALEDVGGWQNAIGAMDVPAQRAILARLVHRVVPTRTSRGKYTVAIEWTPLGDALRKLAEGVQG